MPNWVFNTINDYPDELYDKYKGKNNGEDTDIDFNKVIPEPEELKNTVSGSFNTTAKQIHGYNKYIKDVDDIEYIKYDSNNPLKKPVENTADRTIKMAGELVIESPDETLNELLAKEENKYKRGQYEKYVEVFGNVPYSKCKDMITIYDNYIKQQEKAFADLKNQEMKNTKLSNKLYQQYENLDQMGEKLEELKDKYGFDNWYDWRCANWGTKWNACNTEYDDETQILKFDTAWSIPYPIISKIAQDNPEVKMDGYSEEETGWYDEYSIEDGKVSINARGEFQWEEESNGTKEIREELDPPEILEYEEVSEQSKNLQNNINKYFNI